MRKMKTGNSEPIYEKYVLKALGIERLVGKYRPLQPPIISGDHAMSAQPTTRRPSR
jgi:hypothetical protein